MILNALDEVLFWDDIETLITFTKQNSERFYPHDFENYRKSQDFFSSRLFRTKRNSFDVCNAMR